ncbi:MAG: VIT and VWA domain-containing protein [Dysgonamonadaceae bacterium]|jgi:Ca-activated chloride channel family protein|nr:VIT and VWA domain-containing protein [Dysgonamonadaceae bacterium]
MQTNFEKLSLQRIDIDGNVLGRFSTFAIEQQYTNTTDAVLEVTYTFPISASATVTGFTATVGEKFIHGKVKEKEEAKKDYEKAMLHGDSAYMMENSESNIFRMNIGKIAVGETVKIRIDYIDTFDIVDSTMRIMIPTLVPPRYKSNITDKLSYDTDSEIDYRGNIAITFDKDLKIKDIDCKTHNVRIEQNTVSARNIKLDKDFVLDVKLAEQSFSKGYIHSLPNGNNVVYLSFFPDIEVKTKHQPKDYVFVIDVSGSMMGYKLEQTKEAVIKCLRQLKQGDRLNIIPFESDYEFYSEKMVDFSAETCEKAKEYVKNLHVRGGTELLRPLQVSIQRFGKEKIIFLFTDGEVGNESEIAGWVRQNIGQNSLFVFGIDSSVNKKGLTEIAIAGRGKAEFIVRDEQIQETIVRQFTRVSSSNLFDIQLDKGKNKVIDKIEKTSVLFNHEFYDVLIETDTVADDFTLVCKTDDKSYSFAIPKDTLKQSALPLDKIYAAERIRRVEKYIEARPYAENKGYKEEIVEIAVVYQIDSKYTAFIAVNERDEKLTDIPDIQDTVLEKPAEWGMMQQPRIMGKIDLCAEACAMKYSESVVMKQIRKTVDRLCSTERPTDRLFRKICKCEKIMRTKGNYQALLDAIIKELEPHFASPSAEYQVFFDLIKRRSPLVYKEVEQRLKK